MVSVAVVHAFSAPWKLVSYIWCLFIEPNAFLRRCEWMDWRARCLVFRYCFTLYRDHQSNAFLYSLSRSSIFCDCLLLGSHQNYTVLRYSMHLHLDFRLYPGILAPLAPNQQIRTSSHSIPESHASVHRCSFASFSLSIVCLFFLSFLGSLLKYTSLWWGILVGNFNWPCLPRYYHCSSITTTKGVLEGCKQGCRPS